MRPRISWYSSLLERLGASHGGVGVPVLRLEVGDDGGILAVTKPGVLVDPGLAVDAGDRRQRRATGGAACSRTGVSTAV
jgi:hypothetical protein